MARIMWEADEAWRTPLGNVRLTGLVETLSVDIAPELGRVALNECSSACYSRTFGCRRSLTLSGGSAQPVLLVEQRI